MKTLKQTLSVLLTPALVASAATIFIGVALLMAVANWQDRLEVK